MWRQAIDQLADWWHRLWLGRWRVLHTADVDFAASGDAAFVHIHRRWRRPIEVPLDREDLMDMLATVVDGETVDGQTIRTTREPAGSAES